MAQDWFEKYLENPVDNLFERTFRGRGSKVHELNDPGDTRPIRSWNERDYDARKDGGGMLNPLNWMGEGARVKGGAVNAVTDLFGGLF